MFCHRDKDKILKNKSITMNYESKIKINQNKIDLSSFKKKYFIA